MSHNHVFNINGVNYQFIDTASLNEGSSGKVPPEIALKKLIVLVLRNKEGFNLLIMVLKCRRIDAATERQYKLFVNHLGYKTVSIILVVTYCENEKTPLSWGENNENKDALFNYGMELRAVIGSCGTKY